MGIYSLVVSAGSCPDVNVVPLIDILLVLLVIFMIIPHTPDGAPDASLPHQPQDPILVPPLPKRSSFRFCRWFAADQSSRLLSARHCRVA